MAPHITHSRSKSMAWRDLRITSQENLVPIHDGGSLVDCSTGEDGNCLRDAHWWHEFDVIPIDLSKSRAKKCLDTTCLSWWGVGCCNWIWSAVKRPASAFLGTTIHSLTGAKGSSLRTIRSPSRATEQLRRYLFTSLAFVTFFEGRVPCLSWQLFDVCLDIPIGLISKWNGW